MHGDIGGAEVADHIAVAVDTAGTHTGVGGCGGAVRQAIRQGVARIVLKLFSLMSGWPATARAAYHALADWATCNDYR